MGVEEPTSVITGAAGGVGRAVARRLAAAGHRLVLSDKFPEPLAHVADELGATALAGDVRDATHGQALAAAVGDAPLGAVVCAAGLSPHMADADEIFSVNLIGTAQTLAALLPLAGQGSVAVCIASIAGYRTAGHVHDEVTADPLAPDLLDRLHAAEGDAWIPGFAYAVSKRGVILHVQRQARAWGERGARIVSVSPGVIDTPMGRLEIESSASVARQAEDWSALGRIATADDIAAAAVWFASPEAAYVTGVDLVVDGGLTSAYAHHAPDDMRDAWLRPRY